VPLPGQSEDSQARGEFKATIAFGDFVNFEMGSCATEPLVESFVYSPSTVVTTGQHRTDAARIVQEIDALSAANVAQ
jgi:hypothetical protein